MPPKLESAFALGVAAERRRQAETRQATLARLAEVEAWATAEIAKMREEVRRDRLHFLAELLRSEEISRAATAERGLWVH
jgi:hypothetical protein